MPSDVTAHVGRFDRFAARASSAVSRAWFFAACLLLVVVWAPSILLLRDLDTWQLIINTATTIVTFLLVALLQNSQARADAALQHKMNALAQGLAVVLDALPGNPDLSTPQLRRASDELLAAVGLEDRESTD